MRIDTEFWQPFLLSNLFDIKKGKRLTSEDQIEGDYIYVGAIESNNGVAAYIGQEPIHEGNTISLSYNGSVGEAFYQAEAFWATDDVNVLYPRFEGFNRAIGLFISTVLRLEKIRFSYGRKWTLENMQNTMIKLPVLINSSNMFVIDDSHLFSDEGYVPDWQFMEEYIKSLHYKPIRTLNLQGDFCLNVNDWKEFRIGDIFSIENGKGITQEEIEENPGTFAAVQSGEENNGIMGWIDKDYCVAKDYTFTTKPCLTVARSGSAGYVSFQPSGCVVGDSAKILLVKETPVSKYCYLFLKAILSANRFKYSYGRKVTLEKYSNETIKLPVTENSIPDWQFMEDYIKSLPYGDRI